MLHITDTNTGATATVEAHDVATTLRPWFPESPAEVYEVIDQLQDALVLGQDESGWATYLDITVEAVPAGPRADLRDPARAAYIEDTVSAPVHVVGNVVVLTTAALDELAQLDEHSDGHFDGERIWIGGTDYAVTRA